MKTKNIGIILDERHTSDLKLPKQIRIIETA